MRAIRVQQFGPPEVLTVHDVDLAPPGPGQVLVDVRIGGVNYMDVGVRSGLIPTATVPTTPGVEGVGTVAALGEGVDGLTLGQRVAWYYVPASYAEQVLAPAAALVPVPDDISDEIAAGLLMQGLTAHHLATAVFPTSPGDVCLVHSAAGGVGALLTQIIAARGGVVIARVSTPAKAAVAREAGAQHVVIDRHGRFADEVLRLTNGRGVDAVFDGGGADTYKDSLASLRRHGVWAYYGNTIKPVPPILLTSLPNSILVTYPVVMHHVATREELLAHSAELFAWVRSGELRVHIGGRYPLADAPTGHTELEGRRTTGKLLLFP